MRKTNLLRSGLILGLILVPGIISAQKNQFKVSLLGGYEYFPNKEYPVKECGYTIGAELDYYPVQRFYVLASLHTGVNPGKTGKHSNVGDELTAPTYEYSGVLGVGFDLINTSKHILYIQAGGGASYINEKEPWIDYDHKPDIHTTTKDNWKTCATGLCSLGYDYRLSNRFSIGVNYSAWFIPSRIRNAANIKLSAWL